MQHFEVFVDSIGNVLSAYPHTPSDQALSLQDLIEAKYTSGLELVSLAVESSTFYCVFKVVAK